MTESENKDSSQAEMRLPKLSAADLRTYSRMAEKMDVYHNHFRQSWNTLYSACTANRRPKNLTLPQFLRLGLDFCDKLETHHAIEERYVFPHLARRMPEFKSGVELLGQHRQIHKGLEEFQEYLNECKSGGRELRLREMKGIMDGFREVLWTHLDEEVVLLGAENMRKYWSLEEMRKMPM
ncbi:hypothetical protein AJ80_02305 [Polytolypa hystricis UAMH7299]|uniref:Hemerythrin-like domain-containing protein n=1 Tax=Polytolypa hystricis (strain UAMH7299) TaxID=1447883 RepID=A0A2B7YRM6_POLH7|nr:hypothetical protein AJ80_02305 [Polytolypa hystricis UAMH7299]